jgi:hypothetical protein
VSSRGPDAGPSPRSPAVSATLETLLAAPAGYRSLEVARFLWQMDEQRRALLADVRDAPPRSSSGSSPRG